MLYPANWYQLIKLFSMHPIYLIFTIAAVAILTFLSAKYGYIIDRLHENLSTKIKR